MARPRKYERLKGTISESNVMLPSPYLSSEMYSAFISSLRIPKYPTLLSFFKSGLELTKDDRFKKFELRYSPWIKTLSAWFDDPDVNWIYLLMGSQISKTTFMMGVLLHVAQNLRGAVPCLWVQSTIDEATLFVQNRLRAFLDEQDKSLIKSGEWTKKAFRIKNAPVKVGYATNKTSLRTLPARFVFGDECSIWRESTAYVKKRTRTFGRKRKGIFGYTPPDNEKHHSWHEATAGNFYQWWVPCAACGFYQYLDFQNLKWQGKTKEGEWDHTEVKHSTAYECPRCKERFDDRERLRIINRGKAICVNPKDNFKPCDEIPSDTKTMQVPSMYSVFTRWGQIASDFLTAKREGPESLKIFVTDELAMVPQDYGESLRKNDLNKFIAPSRRSGPCDGYALYTAGVDVQRKGTLYYVIIGWKSGQLVSGHILKYGAVSWLNDQGVAGWSRLTEALTPYRKNLYLIAIDSSDGVVTQDVYDFCNWAGRPYVPLKDSGTQTIKVQMKVINPDIKYKNKSYRSRLNAGGQLLLSINSDLVKDEIAAAFRRGAKDESAWTFPADTDEKFLTHLTNEHRTQRKSGNRLVSTWKPKYSHAPQHYFSSLVYATSAMEDMRHRLQARQQQAGLKRKFKREVRNKGLEIW